MTAKDAPKTDVDAAIEAMFHIRGRFDHLIITANCLGSADCLERVYWIAEMGELLERVRVLVNIATSGRIR